MMKITAGLGALEAFDLLADAGADELFAGYVPLEWLEKYANFTPLNRREAVMQGIQFSTMDEMRLLSRRAAARGVRVALTFNSAFYRPEQLDWIADALLRLSELGFEDWIVADPALLFVLEERDVPGRIHLSGEAGCFSPDAFRLLAGERVSRLIFPRKLSPGEMAACARALPNLEYVAFVLNERCHYSGAFCMSLHCDEMEPVCRLPYLPCGPDAPAAPEARDDFGDGFGESGCALCAIPELRGAGVTHLKVVGRGAHPQNIARDIRLLRRALRMPGADAKALRALLPEGKCAGRCYHLPPFA